MYIYQLSARADLVISRTSLAVLRSACHSVDGLWANTVRRGRALCKAGSRIILTDSGKYWLRCTTNNVRSLNKLTSGDTEAVPALEHTTGVTTGHTRVGG